jgi:hypothetical protein
MSFIFRWKPSVMPLFLVKRHMQAMGSACAPRTISLTADLIRIRLARAIAIPAAAGIATLLSLLVKVDNAYIQDRNEESFSPR